MLTVTEVEQIILDLVKPLEEKEVVTLHQATHRILAEDITELPPLTKTKTCAV